jgi:hypothetical protein
MTGWASMLATSTRRFWDRSKSSSTMVRQRKPGLSSAFSNSSLDWPDSLVLPV